MSRAESATQLLRKFLSYGSQKAPAVIDDVVEESLPLIKRGSTEAVEVGPQVMGKGTSRATKEAAEEVPDAVFRDATTQPTKISTLDAAKEWSKNNPGKIITAATLAEIGRRSLTGDEQLPVSPEIPLKAQEPILPSNYNELAQAEVKETGVKKTVKTEAPKKDGLAPDAEIKKEESEQPIDEYELAKEQANRNAMFAMLGKAASQIGGGIASLGAGSQVKIDGSGFDDLLKMSNRPIEQLKGKQSYEKARAELGDEKLMRDPSSEISKYMSEKAQELGFLKPGQVASAYQLDKMGFNATQLLSVREAAEGRKQAAALSRESREEDKLERQRLRSEEEEKKRFDKRKLATEEIETRKRTINDNIARVQDILSKHGTLQFTGPESEMLQGMLDEIAVDTAKIQDPDSVARPSEVQLVRQNLVPESAFGRATMTEDTAKTIMSEFGKRIDERAAIGYKVRGVPMPGQDVNNNSSGMVKVLPPGGTKPKLIPASQLQDALAAGGKLVE